MNKKTKAFTFLIHSLLNMPLLVAQEGISSDSMGLGGMIMWVIIIALVIVSLSSFVYYIKRSKTR